MFRLWLLDNMLICSPRIRFTTLSGRVYVMATIPKNAVQKAERFYQNYEHYKVNLNSKD